MKNNFKYFLTLILTIFFNTLVFADWEGEELPPPPESEGKRSVPIDMHTSTLLVVGMGLIASYVYFANRRKENIK